MSQYEQTLRAYGVSPEQAARDSYSIDPALRESVKSRLDDGCVPVPESGCWLWTKCWSVTGRYGEMWDGTARAKAHRVSWALFRGPIPDGMFICHKCDTPACVNPDHLFLGTPMDNHSDMVAKQRRPMGLKAPQAKLTDEQLLAVRAAKGPRKQVAARFGISVSYVGHIRRGIGRIACVTSKR